MIYAVIDTNVVVTPAQMVAILATMSDLENHSP